VRLTLSKLLNITNEEFDKALDIVRKELIEFNSFTLTKRAYAQKIETRSQNYGIMGFHGDRQFT
ncbi:3490_t:CDS:2, partial [Racocetra fulgida]